MRGLEVDGVEVAEEDVMGEGHFGGDLDSVFGELGTVSETKGRLERGMKGSIHAISTRCSRCR